MHVLLQPEMQFILFIFILKNITQVVNHFIKCKCKLYEIFFEPMLQSNTALHLGNQL